VIKFDNIQYLLIQGIILLYLFKQILLVEFSFDAYGAVVIILSFLGVISVLRYRGGVPLSVTGYFLIFHLSISLYLLNGGIVAEGYYEGYFVYFLQPFILWISLRGGVTDTERVLNFIANTVFISAIGVILFYINIFSPLGFYEEIFKLEFTKIDSNVVIRNTSIYGNSLIAAGIGLIQLCSAAILIALGYKKHFFTLIVSFLFIASTLSRRSIVAGIVVLCVLYLMLPKSSKNAMLKIAATSSFFLLIYAWEYVFIFIDRVVSSIDFSAENASNTSRIHAIWTGILIIFSSLIGVGFGSLSSLGKTVEDIHLSETFIGVTESMYTTFIGEIGLVFAFPIFVLFYISIYKKPKIIKFLLVYIFMIESIMGLALLNPAINFMFFLIYFMSEKKYFNKLKFNNG
jgi:hypothetical protein